jgi:iron complex outermembrane receptor protein
MSFLVSIRSGLLASALAFTPVGALAQVVPSASMNSTYTIPGGGLTSALNLFAEASGMQISYQATLAEGLTSQDVSGRMSPGEALTALLRGTGLSWRFVDARTVTIERAQRGVMALDPIYVNAAYTVATASGDDESEGDEQSTGRASSTIIVNAQRAQNDAEAATGPWGAKAVLDTPYSISVTSKDLIQTVVAGDMDQIFKMNPVVQASAPTTHNGVPFAAIRGFHSDAGVMDGLRLSSASTGLAMEEIERIEIMNGLSGFMYGVGNPGGVTNLAALFNRIREHDPKCTG